MKQYQRIAAVALAAAPLFASAQSPDGPFLVRLRAINLSSTNGDSSGLGLAINDKVLPEVDLSYFITPNIATELVLTYPQNQTITANGTRIGSLRHLPPTLTFQYHLDPIAGFKPYAGIGVNYTRFSDVSFDPAVDAALHPSIHKTSVGAAFQLGVDYAFTDHIYANLDVKKIQLRTDVMSSGTRVGRFRIDPWLVGVGVGYRF